MGASPGCNAYGTKLAQLENLEPRLPAELIVDISLRLGSPQLIQRATGLGG